MFVCPDLEQPCILMPNFGNYNRIKHALMQASFILRTCYTAAGALYAFQSNAELRVVVISLSTVEKEGLNIMRLSNEWLL
jgi:hypothetical protein